MAEEKRFFRAYVAAAVLRTLKDAPLGVIVNKGFQASCNRRLFKFVVDSLLVVKRNNQQDCM